MSGLDGVIALNSLQVGEATDCKPLIIALSLINHPVNMLSKNFSCLKHDGMVTLL